MAVSTYTTNLTDLYAGAGSTTNWSALGGGAAGLNAETDYFIQGTGMTSKNAFASARKGMIFNSGSDRASTIGTDGAVLMWTTHATPNSLDTIANGGITLLVGSSTSDYKHWYVGGSDTIEFMGWIIAAVNPSETTDEADAGSPSAVEQYFGILFDLPSGGPTKGAPNAIDAIRVGRCDCIYEFGDSTDPDASFDLAVATAGNTTNRWGLIQERSGSFFMSGLHQLGSSTNVVHFTDSNKSLFWNDHPAVTKPFNTVEIQNASSVITMTNISWKALGTKSPGTWTTTDNATVTLTTCTFTDWGTFGFDTNTACDTCTWLNCEAITVGGADLTGSSVLTPNVAANASGLIWNETTDPDGELDGMTFSKTSGTAHHAIEFGTSVPATMTLRNCNFGTDFSNTAGGTTGDETFHFRDTSGTITLNLIGCTGNTGYRTDGATINIVVSPVTLTITASDFNTGAAVTTARTLVYADTGGGMPADVTVTITRSGSTATVTHTAHGLANSDKVLITGANQPEYTGVKTISNVTTNTYDYTVSGTPTTPATGTVKSSQVIIDGTTDGVTGVISDTRSYGSDQPITGRVRRATSGTLYKTSPVVGTIDSSSGLSVNVLMIPDE